MRSSLGRTYLWDGLFLLVAAAYAAAPGGGRAVYTLAAAALHRFWGFPRMHMYPAYLSIACAAVTVLSKAGAAYASKLGVVTWVGVAVALLLEALLPSRPPLPKPAGPYAVAMFGQYLQRYDRGVACIARVYYPVDKAAAATAEAGKYLGHGIKTAQGYAAFMGGVPTFLFSWLQGIPAPFVRGDPDELPLARPPRSAGFPLVVFSHGLGGTPEAYTALVVDLASRGHVVVTPEHTDGSAAYTALPTGQEFPYVKLTPHQRENLDVCYKHRHKQLRQRVREVRACIDEVATYAGGASARLAGANEDSPLAALLATSGGVDMGSVFVAGHSFGGATSLATAEKDPRVLGVLALDPWFFPLSPHTLAGGLPHTPVLSVCGDGFAIWSENAVAWKMLLHAGTRLKHALGGKSAAGGQEQRELGGDMLGAANPDAAVDAPLYQQQRERRSQAGPAAAAGSSEDAAAVSDGEIDALAASLGASNGIDPKGRVHPSFTLPASAAHHPGHLLLRMKAAQHQNFNDFAVSFQLLMQRVIKITGRMEPATGLKALADVNAAFTAAVVQAGKLKGARAGKGRAAVSAFTAGDFHLPPGPAQAVFEHEENMPPVLA